MMTLASAGKRHGFLLVLLMLGPTLAQALTLDDALQIAETRAPEIASRQLALAATRSSRQAAGELPDPKLVAGVENYPISGPTAYHPDSEFMTMEKVGVMQDVPNSAKRTALRERSDADIARTETELRIERLAVRRETALAWLALYFLQKKEALLDDLGRENRLFSAAVAAQLSGGHGSAVDAVLPRQEAAMLADRRDDLERDLVKARAALFRWVGDAASEPLTGDPPVLQVEAEHLRHTLSQHPDLAMFGPLEDAARAELAMAQADKKPGWGVEFDYARRGAAFGDLVSLVFTFDLPIFAKSHQDPQIAAKVEELGRVGADREAMLRQHSQELEELLAERDTVIRQVARLDTEWLPLAHERVDLALAAYRTGREPLNGTLDARKALLETNLKRIDLGYQRTVVETRLRYLNGEDRP